MMRWLALGLVALLSACGSSPKTQFYTLDPVPPQTSQQAAVSRPVQVAAVHLPPALDRQEVVRETAPHQLDISDQNRWGGAFDDMIQRVLTQDMAQRLPPNDVVLPHGPAPPRHDAIVIDILQFDEDVGGNVVFEGTWSLTASDTDKPLASRHVHLSARVRSSSYGDQAEAMSRVLGALSDDIARELAATPTPSVKAHAER